MKGVSNNMQVSHSRSGSVANQGGQGQGRADQLFAPIKACVPRYCFADDIFWFIIECQVEDGRHWELQRLYQDFYDLQIQLDFVWYELSQFSYYGLAQLQAATTIDAAASHADSNVSATPSTRSG